VLGRAGWARRDTLRGPDADSSLWHGLRDADALLLLSSKGNGGSKIGRESLSATRRNGDARNCVFGMVSPNVPLDVVLPVCNEQPGAVLGQGAQDTDDRDVGDRMWN
jgi:hypothetical protein